MRAVLFAFLILAACNRGQAVPTSAQNRDLDDASEMLDKAEDNLSGIDDSGVNAQTIDPQT